MPFKSFDQRRIDRRAKPIPTVRSAVEPVEELAKKPLPGHSELPEVKYEESAGMGQRESGVSAIGRPVYGFDPSVPWRNEAKKTLEQLKEAEDDWEQRLDLIKLANFMAEAQYAPTDPEQGAYLNKILKLIPSRGSIPERVKDDIVKEVEYILREGRRIKE